MKFPIIVIAALVMAGCVSRETRTTERVTPASTTVQTVPVPTPAPAPVPATTTTVVVPANSTIQLTESTPTTVTYQLVDTTYVTEAGSTALAYCRKAGYTQARLTNMIWQTDRYISNYRCY